MLGSLLCKRHRWCCWRMAAGIQQRILFEQSLEVVQSVVQAVEVLCGGAGAHDIELPSIELAVESFLQVPISMTDLLSPESDGHTRR